jgi:hypothetical protein
VRALSRAPHLRAGLVAALFVALLCLPLGFAFRGVAGILGALLGVGIVIASFTLSTYVVAAAERMNFRLTLPAGLMVYGGKVIALGLLVVGVRGVSYVDLRTTALTLVTATVGWITAHAWWVYRAKIPYIEGM